MRYLLPFITRSIRARPSPARGRLDTALSVCGASLIVTAVLRLGFVVSARTGEFDFAHYYGSARSFIEGESPYQDVGDYARWGVSPFISAAMSERPQGGSNPPGLLALTVPFALLPPAVASWTWNALQLLALAGVLWLAWILVRDRISRGPFLVVAGAIALSGSVWWHFYYGQTQLLLAALLMGAFELDRRKRPDLALALVAIAGFLKLFPFALLPWFMWRTRPQQRELAGVFLLVGALVTWPLWPGFLETGMGFVRALAVDQTANFSLPSIVLNVGALATGSYELGRAWWIAGGALGLGGLMLAYRAELPRDRKFALLMMATVLASVTAWAHYFVFMIPAFAIAAADVFARPTQGRLLALAAGWYFGVNVANGSGAPAGPWGALALNYLPLVGVACLAWLLFRPHGRP